MQKGWLCLTYSQRLPTPTAPSRVVVEPILPFFEAFSFVVEERTGDRGRPLQRGVRGEGAARGGGGAWRDDATWWEVWRGLQVHAEAKEDGGLGRVDSRSASRAGLLPDKACCPPVAAVVPARRGPVRVRWGGAGSRPPRAEALSLPLERGNGGGINGMTAQCRGAAGVDPVPVLGLHSESLPWGRRRQRRRGRRWRSRPCASSAGSRGWCGVRRGSAAGPTRPDLPFLVARARPRPRARAGAPVGRGPSRLPRLSSTHTLLHPLARPAKRPRSTRRWGPPPPTDA